MKKSALIMLLAAIFASTPVLLRSQVDKGRAHDSFLVDASKPYVYLEFDHIGPRVPRNEDEPKTGIWLRLHNNCKVPIIVRTFGVPPGSPAGEVGVLDNVVANPKEVTGDGVVTYGSPPMTDPRPPLLLGGQGEAKREVVPAVTATMPHGYMFSASSFVTIAPDRNVYFSLPSNQVSNEWHVEIPFRFDIKVKTPIRSPSNFVSLYKDDLPSATGGSSRQ
jgi:hypothetical protein